MNGVVQREVRGHEAHEHNQEGRSMNAILQPESAPQQRMQKKGSMTPKANVFERSSSVVGTSQHIYASKKLETEDPANLIKPSASFRRASEASMGNRLWTNENDFDLYENKQQSKHEMCKTRSRERYYTSSITTLPGPSRGLNNVAVRQQEQRDRSENDHIMRKKGHTFDVAFSSHINTLPGSHTSRQQMNQDDQFESERVKFSERKYNDPAFKVKNNALHGSHMMDKEKGRSVDLPDGFSSHQKDSYEGKWTRRPSQVSTDARNRLLYQSNFKLE